jgi:hypothetical protein
MKITLIFFLFHEDEAKELLFTACFLKSDSWKIWLIAKESGTFAIKKRLFITVKTLFIKIPDRVV